MDPAAAMAYAQAVQDSLSVAVANGAGTCRWIVDLRANSGGNMWPMLAGLRPFLGDAGLGSFVTTAGGGPLWLRPPSGNAGLGSSATAAGSAPLWHAPDGANVVPAPALAPLESAWVAVLTGPQTGSSGEAVAISFIGRPRTRSFGLPTAGLSTSNGGFALPDGSMILLTTAVEADRTGKTYGEQIAPDEVIPAAAAAGSADAQIERAVAWLKAQPKCKE
jgi:C-terminal processing protease CtpA/Prc